MMLAWTLWGVVFATTVAVYLRLRRPSPRDRHRRGLSLLRRVAHLLPLHVLRRPGFRGGLRGPLRRTAPVPPDASFHSVAQHRCSDQHESSPGFAATDRQRLRFAPGWLCLVFPAYHAGAAAAGREFPVRHGPRRDRWHRVLLRMSRLGRTAQRARTTPRLVADTTVNYPWETFLILALWAWCAWRLVRGEDRMGSPSLSDAT